jgi:penicillin-binding protein 1A
VPEAVDLVLREIKDIMDLKELKHGGYTIFTSLDLSLQKKTVNALVKGLSLIDSRHGRVMPFKKRRWPRGDRGKGKLKAGKIYIAEVKGSNDKEGLIIVKIGNREGYIKLSESKRYNPDNLPASKAAEPGAKLKVMLADRFVPGGHPVHLKLAAGPQGAVVVIDNKTGFINAIAGGDSVVQGGFNRALMAVRQPGSSFKPLVYLAALITRRYTPATLLDDTPEVEGNWIPQNAHGDGLNGRVPLRMALAQSLNLPAIKLIRDIGPQNVVDLAVSMGISTPLEPVPALALGTSGVTPLELTSVYATIASGGVKKGPWIIKSIKDPSGNIVPIAGRLGKRVISPAEAYVMTSLLRTVVVKGTGRKAKNIGFEVAGKTGTTNNAVDAWFEGFSSLKTCGVWVGFDKPKSIGKREYGSKAALPIWISVMKAANRAFSPPPFVQPPGIVEAEIDPQSGLLAFENMENPVKEIFIEGTVPLETALPPDVISLDSFMLEQAGEEEKESETGDKKEGAADTDTVTGGKIDDKRDADKAE